MPYSIDTSSFLDAWVNHYPPDTFPSIWVQMEAAATNGTLFAIEEVVTELGRKDDGAHDWVNARSSMIVRIDEDIEARVREIMGRFPRLVDTRKLKSGGDPWVISLAWARGLHVITGEQPTGNQTKPKIPDVCAALDIRCINLLQFFRDQGWRL